MTLKGKKKLMIEALKNQLGIVTAAANQVKIARRTHYDWLEKDQEYRRYYEDIDNITLDFVENALMKQIKEGNVTAQIFYLKTKGKKRGYIERQEIEHTTGNNYTIEVVKHAKNKDRTKRKATGST